MEPCNYI